MPAKFQLRKASTGKFRFVLLSTRGQVVATSETYERKASALAGIRSLQKIVSDAAVEDTTTTQWAEAEAAKKAENRRSAKKSGAKKAAKKLVTSTKAAAPTAAPKKAAPKKAAPKKAAPKKAAPKKSAAEKSPGLRPVRQPPPSMSTPPEQLTPKI